jgi:hypothetical protein
MLPVTPVIPGRWIPEVTYAENQPEYLPLPAHKCPDGCVTTRWKLSWKERLRVLLSGNIWLQVLTFNAPLQPVKLSCEVPKEFQ